MAITAPTFRAAYRIAHAAGADAGNRSMHSAGRSAWDDTDHAAACDAMEAALCGMGYATPESRAA